MGRVLLERIKSYTLKEIERGPSRERHFFFLEWGTVVLLLRSRNLRKR